jgi:hypothetical protein
MTAEFRSMLEAKGFAGEYVDRMVARFKGQTAPAARRPHEKRKASGEVAVVLLAKVPAALLGKVLDHGKASVFAAHLLAIKCSKGPGFVLWEDYVTEEYGMSRWGFQAGIRLLKELGVLDRWQPGRRRRPEERLAESGGNFVLIAEAVLRQRSAQVAFELAVNLSPMPIRPAQAAKRIGISAGDTIRKLTQTAVQNAGVASTVAARGTVLLARRGFNFDRAKDHPTKIQPTKKLPTEDKRKRVTEHVRKAQSRFSTLLHSTTDSPPRIRASRVLAGSSLDKARKQDQSTTPSKQAKIGKKERSAARANIQIPPYSGRYFFEAGNEDCPCFIRLSEDGYRRWEAMFPYLNLEVDLNCLGGLANDLGKDRWWHGVQAALARRNRKAAANRGYAPPTAKPASFFKGA